MTKLRVPGNLDRISVKLLGRFSFKDLARFSIPVTVTGGPVYLGAVVAGNSVSQVSLVAVLLGATVGVGWALIRVEGRALDVHGFNALRFFTGKTTGRNKGKNEVSEKFVDPGEGSVVGVVEVESVNLGLKAGSEVEAVYQVYRDLFQTVSYPVTVHSRQSRFNLDSYLESLEATDKLYVRFCRGLVGDQLYSTRHLVTVHGNDPGQLEERVNEIRGRLNTAGLSSQQVTGDDLAQLVEGNEEIEFGPRYTHRPNNDEKAFSRTLYVSEFPRETGFAWTRGVLQVDGLVDVVQSVEPQSAASTIRDLQKTGQKLDAELQSLIRGGYGTDNRFQRLQEDTAWFQDLLADRSDQPVRYGAYITVYGETRVECDRVLRQVRNQVPGFELREPLFRSDEAFKLGSLIHGDYLDEKMPMPCRSAATGFPFVTPTTVEDGGILYGRDYSTGFPVVLNPFSWSAGHTVLAGATGSGKSYASKLVLLRSASVYSGLQVNIVDPKAEYGTVHQVLDDQCSVNRFAPDDASSDNTEKLIEAVRLAYRDALDTPEKTVVLVDEAHRLLKDEQGCSVLSTLVREARSSNTAVILVTQAVGDFYKEKSGPDILKNTPCKVLFAHEAADDDPVKRFRLSSREESELYRLAKGDEDGNSYSDAILSVSNRFESKIRVIGSPVEHGVIDDGVVPEITEEKTRTETEEVEEEKDVEKEETGLVPVETEPPVPVEEEPDGSFDEPDSPGESLVDTVIDWGVVGVAISGLLTVSIAVATAVDHLFELTHGQYWLTVIAGYIALYALVLLLWRPEGKSNRGDAEWS